MDDSRIEFKCKTCNAFFDLYAENLVDSKARLACPNCGASPEETIREKFLSDLKKYVETKAEMISSLGPVLDTFLIHSRYLDHTPETTDQERVTHRRLIKTGQEQ